MALGNSGFSPFLFSYRQPAPRRLSYEELEEALLGPQMEMPERPEMVRSVRDLEGEDRRQARQQSLWAGLAGMGALLGGDQRGAMGALGDVQAIQDHAVAGANRRREEEWQRGVEQRQQEIALSEKKQKAQALFGMMEEVSADETPAFQARAERAARSGSMSELEQMRQEKPKRAAARAQGMDPDAWDVNARLEAELKAEMERLAAEKAHAGKLQRLREEEKAKADSELAARVAQNQAGVLFQPRETPAEAAAKAEAVERVRAKYNTAAGGGVKGRIGQGANGKWGWIVPPDKENPRGQFIEIDGQPQDAGGGLMRWTANGVPFVMDKDNPEAGAFEMPVHEPGTPEHEKFLEDLKRRGKPWTEQDSLRAIQSALGVTIPPRVQAEMLKDLKAGAKPRDLEAEFRRDNPHLFRKK